MCVNALTLCLERSWHFDLTLIFSQKRERLIREDSLEKLPEILGGTVSFAEGSFALKCCLMPVVPERRAAVSGTFRRTYEVRSRHIDPAWNLVKVTQRGLGASNENVSFKLVEFGFGVKIW